MKKDEAADERAAAPIERVIIRCRRASKENKKRIPQLIVYLANSQEKLLTFEQEEEDKRDSDPKARTYGVFNKKQCKSMQAYALLLWLFDRRDKDYEHDELPLEQARKLLGWKDVKNEASLGTALGRIVGNSRVLERKNKSAWIRPGISVELESADELEDILEWVGLREARKPSVVVTLQTKVEELLRGAPALAEALARKGFVSPGADSVAQGVALALVDKPAKDVAEALADLVGSLHRERHVARDLLWHILPLAVEWEVVLAQARAAAAKGGALELRLRTETVAEIVVARVEARCCLYAPGDLIPQGAAHVPLPAAAHTAFFDPVGARLAEAVLINLVEEGKPGEPRVPGQDWWRGIKKSCASDDEFKIAAAGEINANKHRDARPYLLVIDAKFDPQQPQELDAWWGVAQGALAAALPGLRLVRLKGRLEEMRNEYDLVPHVRTVRDGS